MEPSPTTQVVSVAELARPDGAASPLIEAAGTSGATTDAQLLAYLANSDHPCPNCSYNLRGLKASACPECNQELKLTIGLVDPKLGAWLAGVLGLAAGAGFSLLLMGFVFLELLSRGRSDIDGRILVFSIIAPGLVLGGSLYVLLRSRPWFRKAPRFVRIALAVAAWLLCLGNLLWFSATLH